MYKRIVGARVVRPEDIPSYMDELDALEDVYFGKKRISDNKEAAKLKGLFDYAWLLKPPDRADIHVPYALLVNLASVAPEGSEEEYVLTRLQKYKYLKDRPTDLLLKKIKGAINWSKDFLKIEAEPVELSPEERAALRELTEAIPKEEDENSLQNTIFRIADGHAVKPGRFFKILYLLLIGSPSGPRLGTYIFDLGKEKAAETLNRELKAS